MEKIKYTKDKLTTSFGDSWVDGELSIDDINNHNFYKDMRRHKSHHWKHEKEWRTWTVAKDLELDPITGFYFLHFGLHFESPLRLRKILIGPRSEEENIKCRLERLTADYPEPKPKIIFTRPSSSTFKIKMDKDRQK